MQPQADDLVHRYQPDAIISDLNIPWTAEIAVKYGIPRLVFHGSNFFALCLSMAASQHKSNVQVSSDSEPFLVPDLPQPVFITMNQMPDRFFNNLGLQEFFVKMIEADRNTYGVVANTFFEIEPEYVKHYEKVTRKVVFPIGPVSLFNTKAVDMVERGNRASIGKDDCMSWLDSKEPNSVIYVCFGSLCKFAKSQLVEIALGLEASKKSFIWVIKDDSLMEDFEKRVKDRGLVIKGWAPQVLILNHPAIGWFMTHCGWNSVLESVCSGVPMITWPLFAEQFYNENLVINQLKIGVPIGVERGLTWGEEEETGVLVRKEQVEEVVSRLMKGGDDEVEGIRKRVNQLRESGRMATSKGGSSYRNIGLLIDDLSNQREKRLSQKRETSDY